MNYGYVYECKLCKGVKLLLPAAEEHSLEKHPRHKFGNVYFPNRRPRKPKNENTIGWLTFSAPLS